MFCPSCGAHTEIGLRYCKGCGARIIDTNPLMETVSPPTASRTGGAAWAIAMATTAITLGGLGIVFSTVEDIVSPRRWGTEIVRSAGEIIPIAIPMIVFGTLTVSFIVFMLIRLFIRLMNLPPEPSRSEKRKLQGANQYNPSQRIVPPPQIQAPPISMPSVTEHTTRNFDQAYSRGQGERQ